VSLCLGALRFSATAPTVTSGFKKVGLIPFNRNWVRDHPDDFLMAELFQTTKIVVPAHMKEPDDKFEFVKKAYKTEPKVSRNVVALDLAVSSTTLDKTQANLFDTCIPLTQRRAKIGETKQTPRSIAASKTVLGEPKSVARIMNTQTRILLLKEVAAERQAVEEKKS
jgi:hypothetical protein